MIAARATAVEPADPDVAAVEAAIAAIARGELVVVTDDDDRENEGDLTMAAVHCTAEQMGFMIRHSSGIVCTPLDQATARRLRLDPMVASNDAPLSTAFTISVDVRRGLTTGISGEQRANTVRALADPDARATDFVRPGHVFPLVARDGGVLVRSGHTEAAVDLCVLADLPPVGVICELMNDDGTTMAGAHLARFVQAHDIRQISISSVIAYRQRRERLVRRLSSFEVPTVIGVMRGYSYGTPFDAIQHYAFVFGDPGGDDAVMTRIHRADAASDLFGTNAITAQALERFARAGSGVFLYLRDAAGGHVHTAAANSSEGLRSANWREVGLGAQILRDLNVSKISLLTSSPRRYVGLAGFGIEIAEMETFQ